MRRSIRARMKLPGLVWQLAVLAVLDASGSQFAAWGEQPASASSDGGAGHVCVDAEVNGERALSYDCLNQKLTPASSVQAGSAPGTAESLVKAPSNKSGTFNYSGESIRFGSNWQKSATPQRPTPVPAVPPAWH